MAHLTLRESQRGLQRPYCFLYEAVCGKCDKRADIRSVSRGKIELIEYVSIGFQCDRCKLKWHVEAYITKRNVRKYGPKMLAKTGCR